LSVRKTRAEATQPAKASRRRSYRNKKPPDSNRDVFINCPFDDAYKPIFNGIVFTIVRSGFVARFQKICSIIDESGYGIHDISRTELDAVNSLPRFNMPLELGLFLGANRFGSKPKRCIIFDIERYRFAKFISDIAGQDIHEHKGRVDAVIIEVATWLRQQSRDTRVPGGKAIASEYTAFCKRLPVICKTSKITEAELTFGEFNLIVADYITKGGATGKVPAGGAAMITLPTPRPPRPQAARPTKAKGKPRVATVAKPKSARRSRRKK